MASVCSQAPAEIHRWNTQYPSVEELRMDCPRCHGTMVVDHFVDLLTSSEIWMPGWRCLMCGEVIDPLILKNRQEPPVAPEHPGHATRPQPPAPLAVGQVIPLVRASSDS